MEDEKQTENGNWANWSVERKNLITGKRDTSNPSEIIFLSLVIAQALWEMEARKLNVYKIKQRSRLEFRNTFDALRITDVTLDGFSTSNLHKMFRVMVRIRKYSFRLLTFTISRYLIYSFLLHSTFSSSLTFFQANTEIELPSAKCLFAIQ